MGTPCLELESESATSMKFFTEKDLVDRFEVATGRGVHLLLKRAFRPSSQNSRDRRFCHRASRSEHPNCSQSFVRWKI